MKYLIDTGVFIQADRDHYPYKFCPGFWDGIIHFHKKDLIFSIDRVFDEICFGDEDWLTAWTKKTLPKNFFLKSDAGPVVKWYAQIQMWANNEPQYYPAVKAAFADETDAWIVAYAGAHNFTVVTSEIYAPAVKNRIPIPNICRAPQFKVDCINVFEMLSRLGVQLVLKT
jgi:hypothetical protein